MKNRAAGLRVNRITPGHARIHLIQPYTSTTAPLSERMDYLAPMLRVGAHGPYALRARIRSAAEEGKCTTRQFAYHNNGRRTVLPRAPTQSIGARKPGMFSRSPAPRVRIRSAAEEGKWTTRQLAYTTMDGGPSCCARRRSASARDKLSATVTRQPSSGTQSIRCRISHQCKGRIRALSASRTVNAPSNRCPSRASNLRRRGTFSARSSIAKRRRTMP